MSEGDVETVVKQFLDVNARNFEAAMDAYADDVELTIHGDDIGGMLGSALRGKAAVGEWFGDWFRQFDRDYHFEIHEARSVDGRVLIVASHHGHGRESGVPVEARWAYIYAVRDGKVARVAMWGSPDAREAALASLETPAV